MATMKQRPGGMWEYRRRVPDRLRETLGLTEVRRTLGTKDKAEARQRVVSVIAQVDLLFATAGQTFTLDHQRISALSATWLASAVANSAATPPDADTIDIHFDALESASEGRRMFPEGSEREASEQRASMIAFMLPAVDSLLNEKGLPNVDQASRDALALQLFSDSVTYWQTMARFRQGNYSPVPGLADRPAWVPPVAPGADGPGSTAVTLSSLYEAWAAERRPVQKTIDSWRSYIRKFCVFLGHDDAARVTGADVVRWKDALVSSGLSASTINNKHMSALRVALGYGKDNKALPGNVALGVSARVSRRTGAKKKRGYEDDEARIVLSAARKFTSWRRWLVFIVAYTGARVSEPADAMADDIKVSADGVAFIDLTERVLKNDSSPRMIPLHPSLIAEGFLEYAHGLPRGGPLFPDCPPSQTYQSRGATASKVISRWVRNDLGIKDGRIQPNHAWRHRMATLHRNAAIPEDASRYLRGYADQDDADHYGTHSLATLAAHMAKIPVQG